MGASLLVVAAIVLFLLLYGINWWIKGNTLTQINSNPIMPAMTNIKFSETWRCLLKERLMSMITEKNYICSIYVKPLRKDIQPLVINEQKFRAASMIKIFIMAEAFRQKKEGLLSMDEEFVITKNVKAGGSGILQEMPEGTHKKLGELVKLMITESDNTATNIIIDRISMDSVNKLIISFGLKNSLLQRKMMDTESIKKGKENYTSPSDLAKIFEKIYYGHCIGTEEDAEMLQILLNQTDNDKIPALLPAVSKIAHKTGELPGALHDGGIVYSRDGDYVVCIMTEDIKSTNKTTVDIATLSKTIYDCLEESYNIRGNSNKIE
jgi:beta-lactamase class A